MYELNTGDVLRLEIGIGVINAWKIQGFHYGAVGQESVIEMVKLDVQPPQVVENVEWGEEVKMYVPTNLIHMAVDSTGGD